MIGIGGSVNFPVQVLSSHALLQEQSSQDSSRRILFPLKTDNFIRSTKKKKGGIGMCVCLCEKYLGYGGAATTYWMMKKCSGADCYNVLFWLLFLQRLAKRLHISTKSRGQKFAYWIPCPIVYSISYLLFLSSVLDQYICVAKLHLRPCLSHRP